MTVITSDQVQLFVTIKGINIIDEQTHSPLSNMSNVHVYLPYCAPSQAATDFSNAVLVGLPSLM